VLLDKPGRRAQEVKADYVGFEIPDVVCVGYGLDYAERFRNLPFIGVLRPDVYQNPNQTTIVTKMKLNGIFLMQVSVIFIHI
jgi:hypothetical protein